MRWAACHSRLIVPMALPHPDETTLETPKARMRGPLVTAGVQGFEPQLTGPEPVVLPVTPYPNGPSRNRESTLPEPQRSPKPTRTAPGTTGPPHAARCGEKWAACGGVLGAAARWPPGTRVSRPRVLHCGLRSPCCGPPRPPRPRNLRSPRGSRRRTSRRPRHR